MVPCVKYYLKKNHRYKTELKPYIQKTREDFELIISCMSHGCIWAFEEYNKEMEKRHNRSEAETIECEIQMADIVIESEERLKELEENPLKADQNFIRWVPDR